METRVDIAIVGAGVSGAAIARRLSQYDLEVALLEREADVSFGTSKANSGIIHGGFHHNRTYLKARLEIEGAGMYPQLHRELGFPYKRCGIVVAAFSEEELHTAEHLYRQGVENDSAGIELCGTSRIHELEPKLHPDVIGGVYAPAGGIIEPYRFVFSLVENAEQNGVICLRGFELVESSPVGDSHLLRAADGRTLRATFVVNAAGLYADSVSALFGAEQYTITPRKGEYHLLDRRTAACPDRVVFPVPNTLSKGMLVIPTVEGTVLLGPTADPIHDKEDLATSRLRMSEIVSSAQRLVPAVSAADIITSFSGLRPTLDSGDFMIEASRIVPGFFHVAGIQSPGLTAAPAVAELVKNLLKSAGCTLTERSAFRPTLQPVRRTRLMDDAELASRWEQSREAGTVVCRCETVTRDEIREAIEAGHTTLDGIKFYCRAGAGRCQGAFCVPKILETVAEETGIELTRVTKRGPGSELISGTLPGSPALRVRPRRTAEERGLPDAVDALVIGGGAAGLAAASEIRKRGHEVLVLDRDRALGGVLRQCIHNGFGIHEYGEELTGPEYAERYIEEFEGREGYVATDTSVLAVKRHHDGFRSRLLSGARGPEQVHSRAVVLAMGSRERNRGGIQIPGSRPAGVMTAGAAQRLINVEGLIPGRRVVIVGSGDIGLIMARRMTLVGASVEAVVEIQPVPSGINRNIVQCLDDFSIPLFLGHVITAIEGHDRVSGVTVAPLENGIPRPERGFRLECDTVLLSVGLVPENEISRELGVALSGQTNGPVVDSRLMTSIPGVFASGNVLHIHDLVDYVAEESRRCGEAVADFLEGVPVPEETVLVAGSNVRYTAPGRLDLHRKNRVYLRAMIAAADASVVVSADGEVVRRIKQHHVQPSEMIELSLDGALCQGASRVEVSIQ